MAASCHGVFTAIAMRSLSLALLLLPGARGFGYFVRTEAPSGCPTAEPTTALPSYGPRSASAS